MVNLTELKLASVLFLVSVFFQGYIAKLIVFLYDMCYIIGNRYNGVELNDKEG